MNKPWLRQRNISASEKCKSRLFLLILDGAADHPENSVTTPLLKALTPALNSVARRATHGLVSVIPGIVPESDSGCMAWLGFDPHKYYTGRGPLEALGCKFIMAGSNAVSFRCNFASWDAATGRLERRTARGLRQSELDELVAELKKLVQFEGVGRISFDLYAFGAHRGILTFHSEGPQRLSGNISNTDPLFTKQGPFAQLKTSGSSTPQPCQPLVSTTEAKFTALVVNQFIAKASQVMQRSPVNERRQKKGELPANFLLLRDGGDAPPVMSAYQDRFGLSVSFFGQIPAERALMQLLGGTYHDAMAGEDETPPDFFKRVLDEIKVSTSDIVMVHFVKEADEAGHDGDFAGKAKAIELFDEFFLTQFLKWLPPDNYLAISSDHATPCARRLHSDDKVPVMLAGPRVEPDGILRFSETTSCGRLQLNQACEFVPMISELIGGKSEDFGA